MSDNDELNTVLAKPVKTRDVETKRMRGINLSDEIPDVSVSNDQKATGGYVQWTTPDDATFIPASVTRELLPAGTYEIRVNDVYGIHFKNIPVHLTDLVRFPDSNSDKVIDEIRNFWTKKEIFKTHNMLFKRGICLWGPPGSGKSCTVQFVMKDVIDKGGIVFKFANPELFIRGLRIFRQVQPDTPVVVLMEDIDSILEMYNESQCLNVLDGIDSPENVVFLATTNYPEKLGARIINRPSRFDKRFKIGFPSAEARRIYFEHILMDSEINQIDLGKWVRDTKDMSIAHLKELYVAVLILGNEYDEAIKALSSMCEDISSSGDTGGMGFL